MIGHRPPGPDSQPTDQDGGPPILATAHPPAPAAGDELALPQFEDRLLARLLDLQARGTWSRPGCA